MVQHLICKSFSKVTRAFISPVVKETTLLIDTPLGLGLNKPAKLVLPGCWDGLQHACLILESRKLK